MNKLARAEDGLNEKEITHVLDVKSPMLSRHLEKLIRMQLIEFHDTKYFITDYGRQVYKTMQEITKAKEQSTALAT